MTALFLAIPLVSGLGLVVAGDCIGRDGKTTKGLLLALSGLIVCAICYGYAVHWGIIRPL